MKATACHKKVTDNYNMWQNIAQDIKIWVSAVNRGLVHGAALQLGMNFTLY